MSYSLQNLLATTRLRLCDIEAMRLLLSGSSVIDWKRLAFRGRDEVIDFLWVNGFRPELDEDRERLWALHAQAIQYLELSYGILSHRMVLSPTSIEDLFLLASGRDADDEVQRNACMVLKVMHIVHHLDARALGFQIPMSDREIFALAEEQVLSTVDRMRESGFPLVDVIMSRKLKDSLITKLLAKKENIAAQIFDKLRVRIVTAEREHLVPLMAHLTRRLFPFNYVIPRESRNRLVDFRQTLETNPELSGQIASLQLAAGIDRGERPQVDRANEFSGDSYRDISFVVDVPLRLPETLRETLEPPERALGPVVFALVEFQLLDEDTALANERGDGSHEMYKRRQMERVLVRLAGDAKES